VSVHWDFGYGDPFASLDWRAIDQVLDYIAQQGLPRAADYAWLGASVGNLRDLVARSGSVPSYPPSDRARAEGELASAARLLKKLETTSRAVSARDERLRKSSHDELVGAFPPVDGSPRDRVDCHILRYIWQINPDQRNDILMRVDYCGSSQVLNKWLCEKIVSESVYLFAVIYVQSTRENIARWKAQREEMVAELMVAEDHVRLFPAGAEQSKWSEAATALQQLIKCYDGMIVRATKRSREIWGGAG
jgi:hypothetical protein